VVIRIGEDGSGIHVTHPDCEAAKWLAGLHLLGNMLLAHLPPTPIRHVQ
jgi:hypothetical protein